MTSICLKTMLIKPNATAQQRTSFYLPIFLIELATKKFRMTGENASKLDRQLSPVEYNKQAISTQTSHFVNSKSSKYDKLSRRLGEHMPPVRLLKQNFYLEARTVPQHPSLNQKKAEKQFEYYYSVDIFHNKTLILMSKGSSFSSKCFF